MGPTPQRKDELIVQILRDQVGIDPRSLRPILRLAVATAADPGASSYES
jgi:hypothetical protein